MKTPKRLNRTLSFQHKLFLYQIQTSTKNRLQNKEVTLCERYDGESFILYKGAKLDYETVAVERKSGETHNQKTLNTKIDELVIARERTQNIAIETAVPWEDYRFIKRQIAFSV